MAKNYIAYRPANDYFETEEEIVFEANDYSELCDLLYDFGAEPDDSDGVWYTVDNGRTSAILIRTEGE